MKILIFVLLLAVSMFSCKGCCQDVGEDLSGIEVGEMHDYFFENDIEFFYEMELNTPNRILNWIVHNIKYVPDKGKEYWQLPEETYEKKEGDCEDFCILFMYLLKTKLNIDSKLITLQNVKTKTGHTLVLVNEIHYEVVQNLQILKMPKDWKIIFEISYPEVMWMTYYYHNNVGKYY